jgi:hypothetical protein
MICIPKLVLEIQDLLLPATVLLPRLDNTAPEVLFNLDADRSVISLHAKNDAKRTAASDSYGDVNSEEEEMDSAFDERENGMSPDGKAADKAGGDGQKLISWSPSGFSVERLAFHEVAGGG